MYRMNCGANLLWQWANSCCLISASAVWVTNCQQKNCPVMHPYSVSCLLLFAPPMNSSKVHRYSFIAQRRVWHSTCKRDILRTIHQLPVARQEEYTSTLFRRIIFEVFFFFFLLKDQRPMSYRTIHIVRNTWVEYSDFHADFS